MAAGLALRGHAHADGDLAGESIDEESEKCCTSGIEGPALVPAAADIDN